MAIASAIILGLVCLVLSFLVIFKTKEDFFEALRNSGRTEFESAFSGNSTEHTWQKLKLGLWTCCGIAGGFVGYQIFA